MEKSKNLNEKTISFYWIILIPAVFSIFFLKDMVSAIWITIIFIVIPIAIGCVKKIMSNIGIITKENNFILIAVVDAFMSSMVSAYIICIFYVMVIS